MDNKLQLTSHERPRFAKATQGKRAASDRFSVGSALILTVVLTSLLAIVGVLFVLVSRLSKIETSAISENKELNLAVDAVVAKISQELVLDVPGIAGQEYYDYPGSADKWLANLEPNDNKIWQHISDIYGVLDVNAWNLQADIVPDYQVPHVMGLQSIADADGDGVADSRWVIIPDMTSSKGKPIFVAVRVIDNGGMLNANTAYKFDPNEPVGRIDGSSQMQINLMALAGRPGDPPTVSEENALKAARVGSADPAKYEQNVIWRYGNPNGPYTPFDISDELDLRNRFLLNQNNPGARINTRVERFGWTGSFIYNNIEVPIGSGGSSSTVSDWFKRANISIDPNFYDYRHIATTYNMDRIINHQGSILNSGKMVNINTASKETLCNAIFAGFYDANFVGIAALQTAAQIAVNIVDYRDADDNVTSFDPPPIKGDTIYYGFERPCIYISELAYSAVTAGDPPKTYRAYAIELYKPYSEDAISASGTWRLIIDDASVNIELWPANKKFYVIRKQEPPATIDVDVNNAVIPAREPNFAFGDNSQIRLQRYVADVNGYITVDYKPVPVGLVSGDGTRSLQRDISKHKCIRRLWDSSTKAPTLGGANIYIDNTRPEMIQAHPYLDPLVYANKGFKNIGEIGVVFVKSAYTDGLNPIGSSDTEATARLNLTDPNYQQIFNYLTVFDPCEYGWPFDEKRIKGRININTAPWYVIAQLPWMRYNAGVDEYWRAKAIAWYRDAVGGLKSTAELIQVPEMRSLGSDGLDNLNSDIPKGPDLTYDTARDDFEERDLIFSRISNLVTVRSDVFTVYMLVRIGTDGPQKRVMAILDRSNVNSPSGKVKVIALHPVADPR